MIHANVGDSNAASAKDFDPTGWELALVTTPSSNLSSTQERQLVGLSVLTTFHLYRSCDLESRDELGDSLDHSCWILLLL